MELTTDQTLELWALANDLRVILHRMNAFPSDSLEISSRAYGHTYHALSDVLSVLTNGEADERLMDYLHDNPDDSTQKCIERRNKERYHQVCGKLWEICRCE